MRRALPALALVAVLGGCAPAEPPLDREAYVASIEEWRAGRLERLTAEDGWLSLVGLHWLEPGANPFGTAEDNAIVLPPGSAAPRAGILEYDGETVRLRAVEGAVVEADGAPAEDGTVLRDDADGEPTELRTGRLLFYVIARDGAHAIRVKDPEGPARTGFEGIDAYPVDPAWRAVGRFVPYEEPRDLEIPTSAGTIATMHLPGTVEIELGGQRLSLQVFADGPDDDEFFVVFKDETSGAETYGLGRFLYAPRDGDRVTVDFNKAYNPPCAFTPYATCPLPPRQNWLDLRVEAGEKAYSGHDNGA